MDQLFEVYKTNSDFREYVNKACKNYNKTVNEILVLEHTKQYYKYLLEEGRINGDNRIDSRV